MKTALKKMYQSSGYQKTDTLIKIFYFIQKTDTLIKIFYFINTILLVCLNSLVIIE